MGKQTVSLDPADLRRWYVDEGLSVRQIGTLTGVPYKTVHRHLIWAGVERRPPGPTVPLTGGPAKPLTEAEVAEIRAAYSADPYLPLTDAGRRFHRTRDTIRRIAGDLRRPPGERVMQRFTELYGQGLRGYQIDRAMGWHVGNAAYHQRRLGLDPHRPQRPLPEPEELRRLYEEEWSTEALAQRLGVSRRRAKEALRAAGTRRHFGARKAPHPLEAYTGELRHAYVDEKTEIEDLASRYGVKASTMRNFLQARGITRTPRLTAADHERILALAASGMRLNAIAREIGCASPTVRWHLRHPQQQRRRRSIAA